MSHGGLKRARSWKQRIQPKEAYSLNLNQRFALTEAALGVELSPQPAPSRLPLYGGSTESALAPRPARRRGNEFVVGPFIPALFSLENSELEEIR